MPAASRCSAAFSIAWSVTELIWSACSVTPRTVATTTPAIRAMRPRTMSPAAKLGFIPWRSRTGTSGLKTMASTAAKVIGKAISLTAPSAMDTMIIASTTPTKHQAQIPSLGTRFGRARRSSGVAGPPSSARAGQRCHAVRDVIGPGHQTSASCACSGRAWDHVALSHGSRVLGALERIAKRQVASGRRERRRRARGQRRSARRHG